MPKFRVALLSQPVSFAVSVKWQIVGATPAAGSQRTPVLQSSYDHATHTYRGSLHLEARDELDAYVEARKYLGDKYADP